MDGTGKPTVVHCCSCSRCRSQPDGPTAKQHRALNDLVATLDEKSRHLVVGLLAKQPDQAADTLLGRSEPMQLAPSLVVCWFFPRRAGRLPANALREPWWFTRNLG